MSEAKLCELLEEVRHLLPNIAQLLDGWHNDGTAWSEWDEQQRNAISKLQARLEALNGGKKPMTSELLKALKKNRIEISEEQVVVHDVFKKVKNGYSGEARIVASIVVDGKTYSCNKVIRMRFQ